MKDCPSCGAPSEEGARFCLECGHAYENVGEETEDPWGGRVISGRFRLIRKLGSGGMGDVFLADQQPMGRPVALKLLHEHLCEDPQQVERFKREAQAASSLKSPHTIIVHDFGQDQDGTLFIAMEYLEGRSLADVMDESDTIPPSRIAHILAQVARSLDEAHVQGVVHRDLKPENIFLIRRGDDDDFVKVLDFGIAKVHHSASGGKLETLTQQGVIFGTPQYMSPEQIRGGANLDARSDIYALGVILYQALSGHLPFTATTAVEMLTKHLSEQPAPLGDRDTDTDTDRDEALTRLSAVAFCALSKDPAHRQQSARAFLEDLMTAIPELNLAAATGMSHVVPMGSVTLPAPRSMLVDHASPEIGGGTSRATWYALLVAALAMGVGGAWYVAHGGNGGGGGTGGTPNAIPAALAAGAGGETGSGGGEEPGDKKPAADAKAGGDALAGEGDADSEPTPEEQKTGEEEAKKAEEAAAAADAVEEKEAAEEEAKIEAILAEAKAGKEAEAQKAADALAAKIEAEAEAAKAKQGEEEAKANKAEAEEKAKAAELKEAEAEAKAAEAEAAKTTAEAEKRAAEEVAAAERAKAAADKAAAEEETKKAREAAAAAKVAQEEAAKKAALAEAKAAQLEADLAKIEEEKAAAEAAKDELLAKEKERKEAAARLRKFKRAKQSNVKRAVVFELSKESAKSLSKSKAKKWRLYVKSKPIGSFSRGTRKITTRLREGKYEAVVVGQRSRKKPIKIKKSFVVKKAGKETNKVPL